jgi:manganese/zinc/iron transport system permease protein
VLDYNTIVVLAGVSLLGACAGMVGTFAVLRRRALTGDAVAHAALPGVCLGFLVVGERRLAALLLGAFLTGLLGVVIISFLRGRTRIKEDAAIGIVLSVFVGFGFVLSRIIQNSVTGGSKAGLNRYILGQAAGMVAQDVYLIGATALACLIVILLLYKELKLIAFDPGFARVQGWPAHALDLVLMALLAATVVIGLPAVGAILVAALVIAPAATARLWADRLGVVLLLSALFGSAMGVAGVLVSSAHDKVPTGPAIVLAGAGLFVVSLLLAPRRGLASVLLARWQFHQDLADRHLLCVVYDLAEQPIKALGGRLPATDHRPNISFEEVLARRSWGRHHLERLLRRAVRRGHLVPLPPSDNHHPSAFVLTADGIQRAAEVARGHRLWEAFLAEHPEQATTLANLAEESVEGLLPEELIESLRHRLEQEGRLPASFDETRPAPGTTPVIATTFDKPQSEGMVL